jgi:16S rRNA processing protein RimM
MALVCAGYVLGVTGVRGHLKCAYTTDNPELLPTRPHYLLRDPRTGECAILTTADVVLRETEFLIRFQEYSAPEPMRYLAGWDIMFCVRRGELPREPGEVYFFELDGLEVRTATGRTLGRVVEVHSTPAGISLELNCQPPRLIPFTKQYVPDVDLEGGFLITAYPLDDVVDPERDGGGQ